MSEPFKGRIELDVRDLADDAGPFPAPPGGP
jgi:hypothetical protein